MKSGTHSSVLPRRDRGTSVGDGSDSWEHSSFGGAEAQRQWASLFEVPPGSRDVSSSAEIYEDL